MTIQKVLIVGYGSIGERYFQIISGNYPEIEVALLRHNKTGSTPHELKDNKIFYKIADALAFSPDVAIICNPASMHISVSHQLAENNIHLLVEKTYIFIC